MPTKKPELLFVNKTSRSKSLTNSRDDTEGLREIHRHAQRSRDYEKEKERRRWLRKSNLPLGWAPISPVSTRTLTLGHRRIAETPNSSKHDVVDETGLLAGPCPKDEAKHGTPILSAITPTGATVEPFNQFRISMNTEKYRILKYFVLRYFPAVTRLDVPQFMGRPEPQSSNPAVLWIRNALTNEVHLLALLAAASARLKYVDRAQFAQFDLPEQLAEAALRNMRRYLGQVESYKRNWNGVNTHRDMLLHLTDTYLGGFQNLEPYTRRMLWFADRFQAAATQTPPVIEEKWVTEDLTAQQYKCVITAIREHGRHPMALGFIQASEIFSTDFQKLVQRIVELCSVVQCRWIGVSVQPLIRDRDWAVGRGWSISDELISFKDDPLLLRSLRYRRLQDCVRLALIAWLAFVPASANHSPDSRAISAPMVRAAIDARPLRARLAGVLESHGEKSPPRCEEILLFWVAALGVVTSELAENQEWFALHFQAFARQLEIYTWEEFTPINERFLLLEYLQPANCTKLTWLLQRAAYR